MSGGPACGCPERRKPLEDRAWRIRQYRHNNSAFNGYRHTSSDYSAMACEACRANWRTKAGYVDRLRWFGGLMDE